MLFLSGCGLTKYHSELYIDGKKKAELKGNVPTKAKCGDIELDQRNETMFEKIGKMIPKDMKIEQ